MRNTMRLVSLLALLLVAVAVARAAEVYPERPVRVIVPFGPGGGTDIMGRVMAQQLSTQLGKQFVVDDRGGAGGRIGAELAAKAPPTGYTLYVAELGFATNAALYPSLPYSPLKDFVPISEFVRISSMLVVVPQLKVNTLSEFIALAKTSPGKFNYGSPGVGASNQLMAELFKGVAKVNINFISYSGGGGELISAMLGEQIQMIMIVVPTVQSFIKSGQLKALAITTDGTRSPALPEVPSFKELGIPGMEIYTWIGYAAPAGTPQPIIRKLNEEMVRATKVPAVRDRLISLGGEVVGSSPEEFSALIKSEITRWTKVVKESNIKVD